MTNTSSREVTPRRASAEDAPRLIRSLAAAFYDDPVFGWLMPDPETRRDRLARFFRLELLHLAFRHGDVWATDRLTGAALCMPPGAWHMPASVAIGHGREFARMFGVRLPLASGLFARMERRHLRRHHFYFAYIGVVPEEQ